MPPNVDVEERFTAVTKEIFAALDALGRRGARGARRAPGPAAGSTSATR